MRKIQSVRLQNFQSHVDSTIEFDDYNIIHGSTNAGKSSIIRGIRWALYNATPAEGAEIRRFGTKETIVTIVFDDGRKIIRRRTNKDNEYILVDENGNEQKFTQFGRGPLKEVQEFHEMYQVNLFGEPQSINIVDQDEPPFFLSQGPTARGHLISRLAGTLLYESALVLMKRDASAIGKDVDVKRAELEKENDEIEKLSYIDELDSFIRDSDECLQQATRSKTVCQDIRGALNSLSVWMKSYIDNSAAASISESAIENQELLNALSSEHLIRNQMIVQVENLKNSLTEYQKADALPFNCDDVECALADIEVVKQQLLSASSINTLISNLSSARASNTSALLKIRIFKDPISAISPAVDALEKDFSAIKALKESVVNAQTTMRAIAQNKLIEEDANIALIAKSKEYSDCLAEVGVCPTCHQPVGSNVRSDFVL